MQHEGAKGFSVFCLLIYAVGVAENYFLCGSVSLNKVIKRLVWMDQLNELFSNL